jgi:hypothetical protein
MSKEFEKALARMIAEDCYELVTTALCGHLSCLDCPAESEGCERGLQRMAREWVEEVNHD